MSRFLKGLRTLFKRYFVSGLIVLIPIVGTVWILKTLIIYADGLFVNLLPMRFRPEAWLGRDIPGIGFLITIVLIILVGMLTRHYVGRAIMRFGDRIIAKIPIGRGIYKAFKQFMDAFVGSEEKKQYKRVVAVEYPRRGCFMVGFVLGPVQSTLQEKHQDLWISIFLPTSPNPTSGFMISVPEKETIPLPISTDQAFKYIISGSVDQPAQSEQRPHEPQAKTET